MYPALKITFPLPLHKHLTFLKARLQIPPQEISHPLNPVYLEFVESRLLLSVFGLIAWGLCWIVEIPVVRVAAS